MNAMEWTVPQDAPAAATDFQREVYCLLGLPVDALTEQQAVRLIRGAAEQGRRCFFSTPNLNFLVGARSDAEFRNSVLRSDLSLADGMPLVWIARLLGAPVRERVAGSSLFEALGRQAGRPLGVYFFGGPPGAAQQAHARLQGAAGGLVPAGFQCPGFGSVEDMSAPATLQQIAASRADVLVVALGAKKGQAWIEHNLAALDVPVVSHLGAVVNFAAGTLQRAPTGWQKLGLEWLWRIKEEPSLWLRYLRDGRAFLRLMATRVLPAACLSRWHRASPRALRDAALAAELVDGVQVLRLRGAWTGANLAPLREGFDRIGRAGAADVRLDLAQVTHLDAASLGLLLLLRGHQSKRGRRLEIVGCTPRLRRLFHRAGAEFLLDGA